VKSEQLLTQGKIFEDDILAGPECTNNPAEEVPEPYDHAQNLTGTLSIELGVKSLILRVYEVLMTDKDIVEKIQEGDERSDILKRIDALEKAQGTKSFVERYTDFISAAANHMTVIAPFIPALSELLKKALGG
jgi:hypothetical protein